MRTVGTSLTDPLLIHELRVSEHPRAGVLGLTFCPGKHQRASSQGCDWARDLDTDLDAVRDWGAAAVVTLMTDEDLARHEVPELGRAVEARGMDWFHLPIRDGGVPDEGWMDAWTWAGLRLRQPLREGRRVLLHCRGGLGRTGTVAGMLLVELGWEPDRAIRAVRAARQGAIENRAQESCVRSHRAPAWDDDHADRVLGCLLGGAVGDAFGYAIEFDSIERIRAVHGPRGLREPVLHGGRLVASDDTQMTLFTLEGMRLGLEEDGRAGTPDRMIDAIGHAYRDWLDTQTGAPSRAAAQGLRAEPAMRARRAPGSTCLKALEAGGHGTRERPINGSKGCGAVMRTAPLGFLRDLETTEIVDLAQRAGALTHGHPDGWLPGGAMAGMVASLLRGASLTGAVRAELARPGARDGALRRAGTFGLLARALELGTSVPAVPPDEALAELGEGWTGDEALAVGVYAALSADGFEEIVRRAANHSGDSDSTASVAGQLAGACRGAGAVPQRWVRRLDLLQPLLAVAGSWLRATAAVAGDGARTVRRHPLVP